MNKSSRQIEVVLDVILARMKRTPKHGPPCGEAMSLCPPSIRECIVNVEM
jgi:hypothetical protein